MSCDTRSEDSSTSPLRGFKLVEVVTYENGGSSSFFVDGEEPPEQGTAVIVDAKICEVPQGSSPFSYSRLTSKQNEYMSKYGRVFRVLEEDIASVEAYLEGGDPAESLPERVCDRADVAEASPLEHHFEERFSSVYGADSLRFLQREYGVVDLEGHSAYLDYVVYTKCGRIAVEENGVTYHHPQHIGRRRYRRQLLKQNSCVAEGIKLYRFSTEDCRFVDRLEDDIRRYFGDRGEFLDQGIEASRPFELYEHQQVALEDMEARRRERIRSFLVVLPTAAGKSRIVEEDMLVFARENGDLRALVLVPNLAIEQDWRCRVAQTLQAYASNILVCTYAYMNLHMREFERDEFDYVVVDEAHHAVAPTVKRCVQHFDPKFLVGLTATDQRPDKKRLEDVFGAYKTGLSLKDAMKRGIVARANVFRVETNIDLSRVRVNGRDYVNADLEKTIRVGSRNELIADVVKTYFGEGAMGKRQGVVFCVNARHAQEMERLLNAVGIPARAYTSKSGNCAKAMQDFREGRVRFLCSCQMISEGWDYPELGILIMARPTLSRVLYLQQLGRGLRRTRTKENVVVVDVVDSYGAAVTPCSMHSVFANPCYVPFGDILKTDYKPGDLVEVDGLAERVERIMEVDVFSYAEKYEGYLMTEQVAREFFVSTGTVSGWIKKGQVVPSASITFGSKRLDLFSPEDVERIRCERGIAVHDDSTVRKDFFDFLEERDYSLSYKMVFMLSLLDALDGQGDARTEQVLDGYIAFYRDRLERGLRVDRATCKFTLETLEDRAAVKANMLTNPFEKFERKRFMYQSKDLGIISLNHALHAQLSPEDYKKIRSQMEADLKNYYENL